MRRRHIPIPGWNDGELQEMQPAQPADPNQIDMQIAEAMKETNETVGMGGALGRVRSGGVGLRTGAGMEAIVGGVRKTQIETDGTFKAGADIDTPEGLSFAVFTTTQTWNGEEMDEGDALFGDNSDETSNVKWDASEGQLQFRFGTTVNVFMDTDGSITIENDVVGLSFGVSDPDKSAYLKTDTDDNFWIANRVEGKLVRILSTLTDSSTPAATWGEDAANANVSQLNLEPGTNGGKINIGSAVIIWAGKDGTETVFNDDGFDINHRWGTATNTHGFYIDGGDEYASFFGASANGLLIIDNGTDKRLEIGQDHYFPTRDSNNKTVYLNEAGQDIDFIVKDAFDNESINVNAGTGTVTLAGKSSGRYTPTLTNTTNISASTVNGDFNYIRYDDIVEVWGSISIDPTATGSTVLTMSIPISTTFDSNFDVHGGGSAQSTNTAGNISGVAGTATVTLTYQATDTANRGWKVWFSYTL